VLLGQYMRQVPTILSMDATPINMDTMAHSYDQKGQFKAVERAKYLLVRRSFRLAAHLVSFSNWVKNSLIEDYGIPDHKISVIAPGLNLDFWNITVEEGAKARLDPRPHVLFVGGDFHRKGGATLLQSAASMRERCIVDIVTNSETFTRTEEISNVRIHRGLKAGSPELLTLYRNASIFVLPTLGDCSPWSIVEAMAMRLPVVATPVGAIPEMVRHNETGLLIRPASPESLTTAIDDLVACPDRRQAMGDAGRRRVEQNFDGGKSYGKLIALIKDMAETGRQYSQ
jgi:glycosyltransferase involved in cell wall biosynthesis